MKEALIQQSNICRNLVNQNQFQYKILFLCGINIY